MTTDSASSGSSTPPAPPQNGPATPSAIAGRSALECLLTFVLLFGVTTIVRWVMGPSALSDAVPGIHLKLLIVGAAVGLLISGLILSRPGRLSGGHLNPAISLAMWRFGVFPGVSVAPYVLAQLVGSFLGVLAARAVWGPVVGRPPVLYATLQPAPGWTDGWLFAAEAAGMGVIVYLVGYFLQTPRLAPAVPWLVGFLIGAATAVTVGARRIRCGAGGAAAAPRVAARCARLPKADCDPEGARKACPVAGPGSGGPLPRGAEAPSQPPMMRVPPGRNFSVSKAAEDEAATLLSTQTRNNR
ncbi:aquaporin [Streptomyces sp. NPDC047985]|uniref:aquaporin n=1 Tax=unclassified Streptomyces TaxID=2593676 RepID=UPI00341C4832